MKLIIFLLFIFPSLLYSQRSIKGVVVNASNEAISNANVFIQNKDSVIKNFTKTSSEGRFDLKNFDLQNGDLLRVSHINYRPFSQKIDLLVDTFISIKLIKDSVFLNEVIVNTKIPPVRNIGDTTKYSLPSFINGSEIRLEDILKKLPGIVVDNNCKLSFNGKQIDKVLIEGQNFFSKDYTLIT
ncbi:MAG: carboxypeptidase-like regulatory domain-containing protein, partial [Sediminibacterium sp.]|nr:carboxypeptidase-like regulatory domain-containing protein [Sediminibacterium sp.]